MKRILIILCVAVACAGIGWAGYRAVSAPDVPLSKFVPAGPLLYLEAQDFSALLSDWNSSAQKKQWIKSDNYEVFSRSRLFLRLQGAGEQFAAAAGIPPDMDFFSQVAGRRSTVAIYDIGKLEFLYITYLPSAKSMQSSLYQTRAKFEPRNAGGVDPELLDLQGRLQPRDLVRLVRRAAESVPEGDRLTPLSLRSALPFCSEQKIKELEMALIIGYCSRLLRPDLLFGSSIKRSAVTS